MTILDLHFKNENRASDHPGESFDFPGYESALRESGYTSDEAKQYWNDVARKDPYAGVIDSIQKAVDIQAPKVSVRDGKIVVSAPKSVLESSITSQVKEQLQLLKGADLSSPEVENAVNALNEEIRNSISDMYVDMAIGWTPEELKDYQYAVQTVNVNNPMKSTNKIKGYDKDGKIQMKTPQEWINYYREVYNVDERTDAFSASLESDDPYGRTMALVMSQGAQRPVYGFDALERIGQGVNSFGNQMMKLPEGIIRLYYNNPNVKLIDEYNRNLKISYRILSYDDIEDEARFERYKKEIEGKKWNELSSRQQAFLLKLGAARVRYGVGGMSTSPKEDEKRIEDLTDMSAVNASVSRDAIKNILEDNVSFERYKEISNGYDTIKEKERAWAEDDERLAKNYIWSGSNQNRGAFLGTLGRYLWEDVAVWALTGGNVSMMHISDELGEGIVNALAKIGISPASPAGQGLLTFAANLMATIPEDIIQDTVDSVILDSKNDVVSGENISQNLMSNIVVISLFNAGRAGYNAVQRARMAKKIAKMADLNQEFDLKITAEELDSIAEDVDKAVRVAREGGEIKVENGKVIVVDKDGNESVLKKVTPEQGELMRKQLLDSGDGKVLTATDQVNATRIKDADAALIKSLYGEDADPIKQADALFRARKIIDIVGEENSGTLKDTMSSVEKSLKAAGYEIEDYTGRKWEDGMNADVVADESGDVETKYVSETISPAIIKDGEVVRKAQVVLSDTLDTASKISSFDDLAEAIKKASDEQPTTRVEIDTVEGPKMVETVDYRFRGLDDVVDPNVEVKATPASIKSAHSSGMRALMKELPTHIEEFHNRFGDVGTSEFDWIFSNTKYNHMTPEQIIGTVDPVSKRVITQNTIDAVKWWGEQPFVKKLRMASREALGKADDYNVLGYLPHTNYDPSAASFDEALSGMLWKESTGKNIMNNGEFVGYGGTLESRYRTYASNMLWDMRAKEVAAAKLVEEADLDGKTITPEQAIKVTEGQQGLQKGVNATPSAKAFDKALISNKDVSQADWDKMNEQWVKDAQNSGIGKATHDVYRPVFKNSNTLNVKHQRKGFVNSFDSLSNFLRRTTIGNDLSMYDWGAARIIYAPQDAEELFTRWQRQGAKAADFRDLLTDYIIYNSHRSPETAAFVADKWIQKIGAIEGPLTKAKIVDSLAKSMKWEGWNRLRKWLVMARYDQFNESTKKNIDRFLYDHMRMESITNNPTINQKITNALNTISELRYDALFYGNVKNALLQTSELNRYFSAFKWGDVATMAKRLATEPDFRARVEVYYNAVAPRTRGLEADLYSDYSKVADVMKVEQDGVRFGKLSGSPAEIKKIADDIGLAPINSAESFKNRMLIAGLVQEADRLKLSGNEALAHIRKRFERVGLAADEMGRIGLSANPFANTMLLLQKFQIREIGMHLYNILDNTGILEHGVTKKGLIQAAKYLTKVFGAKLATTLLLSRLGYSASQTLGLDPFGVLEGYNQLDEEDMNWVDKNIAGGLLTPFFSGGITSLLADMYFMARKAYEDSVQDDLSSAASEKIKGTDIFSDLKFWEHTKVPDVWKAFWAENPEASKDYYLEQATNFIPGSTLFNRIGQMDQMIDTGWATSSTGNKMYTAPNDIANIILGYLFGRSATDNALRYNQTYGDSLGQTLSRTVGRNLAGIGSVLGLSEGAEEFDPIDTKNYSDWFKGDGNDKQQFEKGRRYFQRQRDRIIDAYEEVISKSYASDSDISEAKNNMNAKLDELYDQLERFVAAYEKKNGTIDSSMVSSIVSLLNTGRKVLGDTEKQAEDRRNAEYNKALERYAELGISPVGTYTGPTEKNPDAEVKYQGSPQWRTGKSAKYTLYSEAVEVLEQADLMLEDERKAIKESISAAYDAKDYDTVAKIQNEYLTKFDNVVGPIIALYGYGILSSTDVVNQLKDMLSTGTSSRSGDLIPSSQYKKDKYGKYRSMPLESVDVKKWAQQRYGDDIYKRPTVRSYSTAEEDINEIKRLSSQGKAGRARARALELKVRVDNKRRALSDSDYQWLLDFLNNGGEK